LLHAGLERLPQHPGGISLERFVHAFDIFIKGRRKGRVGESNYRATNQNKAALSNLAFHANYANAAGIPLQRKSGVMLSCGVPGRVEMDHLPALVAEHDKCDYEAKNWHGCHPSWVAEHVNKFKTIEYSGRTDQHRASAPSESNRIDYYRL
jgi:hypothetical protein